MATIYHSQRIDVSARVAWDFVERYTRSEVHVFSACTSERQESEYRVVTLKDGTDVWERNVTVDRERMRAVYTVPGIGGSEHHQAEMRVVENDGDPTLVWITDILPDSLAPQMLDMYKVLFSELVSAVEAHVVPPS